MHCLVLQNLKTTFKEINRTRILHCFFQDFYFFTSARKVAKNDNCINIKWLSICTKKCGFINLCIYYEIFFKMLAIFNQGLSWQFGNVLFFLNLIIVVIK